MSKDNLLYGSSDTILSPPTELEIEDRSQRSGAFTARAPLLRTPPGTKIAESAIGHNDVLDTPSNTPRMTMLRSIATADQSRRERERKRVTATAL